MSKLLTEQDFQNAARKLRCDVAIIKAVAEVESRGKGFYADGFPVILFERHIFRRLTKGRYDKSHPHLSGPAGNYGAAGQNQRKKFNEAFALNPIAAMKSCSWGKFQIMGFNHAVAGFATVGEFVDAMKKSEGEHLQAFVNFIINNNLADELRNKNWAAFARGYNGAGYRKNKYDEKLAAAYKKYAAQKIKKNSAIVPDQSIQNKQSPIDSKAIINQQDVKQPAEIVEPKPQRLWRKLSAGIGALFSGTAIYTALEKFDQIALSQTAIIFIILTIVLAFLGFCFWAALDAWKSSRRVEITAMANTDINRKDIKWVSE